jgi:uncharacterized protein YdeI (YjbR/CyaY-like superfamily)
MNRRYFESREAFRTWLADNCMKGEAVWIEYFKDDTPGVSYQESLEEALCFGWIDSRIKRIDDRIYLRKFSPRLEKSRWSKVNRELAERLIAEGRMTGHGMEKIDAAKKSGRWDGAAAALSPRELAQMARRFRAVIADCDGMIALFDKKGEKTKQLLARYYFDARTDATRARRVLRIRDFLEGKISML